MNTTVINATEYRDVPLAALFESITNPRHHFDEAFLKGLAASIRANGVLSPLLVRPKNERLEIVFGAQRYRAAQIADAATVPVSIREMTDAQVLEAQLVENLQRRDVHPMEEAQGLRALLDLEVPKYSIEQIAAKTGKTCKYTTEAIVADGTDKGEIRKVCANPDCPVHHPKKRQRRTNTDAAMKAAQEKQRREEAQAQANGLRVLRAVGDAVPVRLMKRDLLFVVSRLSAMLDERKLAVLIRLHGVRKPKDREAPAKLLAAFLPKAEESKLGRILVESVILLTMHNQADAAKILRDAAHVYKVDVDAISATVKHEFAAKERGKASKKAASRSASKPAKKAAA